MTFGTTLDWMSGTRSEKPWRPADYPPLASVSTRGDGAAVRTAFSLAEAENAALIAHLRERLAASEEQLLILLEELQRLRGERESLLRQDAAKAVKRWYPFHKRAHSHRDGGTPELTNASPHVPTLATWDWGI